MDQVVTHSEMSTACYSTESWSSRCTKDRWHQQSSGYGNRAPEVPAGPSHIERQRGFQEKGLLQKESVCVTEMSLKIFGELMAESSLWHLQLAEPSGCYKMGQDPGCPALGNEYTLLFLSKGWLSCPTSGVHRFNRLQHSVFCDISNTHR